jgi:hypothetical protein
MATPSALWSWSLGQFHPKNLAGWPALCPEESNSEGVLDGTGCHFKGQ